MGTGHTITKWHCARDSQWKPNGNRSEKPLPKKQVLSAWVNLNRLKRYIRRTDLTDARPDCFTYRPQLPKTQANCPCTAGTRAQNTCGIQCLHCRKVSQKKPLQSRPHQPHSLRKSNLPLLLHNIPTQHAYCHYRYDG